MARIPEVGTTSVSSNPIFDSRIITRGVAGNPLTRGRIITDASILTNNAVQTYMLNFLYNPDSIQLSYSVALGDTTPLQPSFRNPGDTFNLPIPLQNFLTFGLLFDRTYEVAYNTGVAPHGVYDDVAALYNIVGINQEIADVPQNKLDDSGKPTASGTTNVTGPMQMNTCFFYFGGQKSLSYYGMIQSLQITYTHWSIEMVPVRCAITVNAQLLATDAPTAAKLSVPDQTSADYGNNSSDYNYFLYSYQGPTS